MLFDFVKLIIFIAIVGLIIRVFSRNKKAVTMYTIAIIELVALCGIFIVPIHHFHFSHYTSAYHLPPNLWGFALGSNSNPSVILHRSYISDGTSEGAEGPGEYRIEHVTQLSHNKLKVITNKHGLYIITYDGGGLNGAGEVTVNTGTRY